MILSLKYKEILIEENVNFFHKIIDLGYISKKFYKNSNILRNDYFNNNRYYCNLEKFQFEKFILFYKIKFQQYNGKKIPNKEKFFF